MSSVRRPSPLLAMLVAAFVIAWCAGCTSSNGRPNAGSASAYLDQRQSLSAAVLSLCQSGTPIIDAQPVGGDYHPLVLAEMTASGGAIRYWQPARAADVQLIACFEEASSKAPLMTCTYGPPVGQGSSDVTYYNVFSSLRILDARTGQLRSTLTLDSGQSAHAACPSEWTRGSGLGTDPVWLGNSRIWTAIQTATGQSATVGDCTIIGAAKVSSVLGSEVTAVQSAPDFCLFEYTQTPTPAYWPTDEPHQDADKFSVLTSPYESVAAAKKAFGNEWGHDLTVAGDTAFLTLDQVLYVDRDGTTLVFQNVPASHNEGRGDDQAWKDATLKIAEAILQS